VFKVDPDGFYLYAHGDKNKVGVIRMHSIVCVDEGFDSLNCEPLL